MLLSRLESSLLRSQRSPFLSAPGEGGGGGGAGAGSGGESSGSNANSRGNGGGSEGGQGAGQGTGEQGGNQGGEAKPETVTFVHEGKTYVLQDHVNTLVGNARKEGKTTAEAEVTRLANEAAAKSKGNFEKLATDRQARIDELKRDIAERDKRDLRKTIAAKHNLPADLADRLVGDDEAALEEDAEKLAKTVGTRKAPDTEGGGGDHGHHLRRLHLRPAHRGQIAWVFAGRRGADRRDPHPGHSCPGDDATPRPSELVVPRLAGRHAAADRPYGG